MKKKRSVFWRLLGALALLPALLFAFIQTPPGKKLLANGASNLLSRSEHLDVRISGVSGWIPGDTRIESLEVGDARGEWLAARGLRCRWMLRDLFDQRIRFAALDAKEITWRRFPNGGEKKRAERPAGEFEPREIALERLTVERFIIEKGVAGTRLEYAVRSGGVRYQTDGALLGELMVGGDADGRVELEASFTGAASDQLKIRADLQRMNHPTFGLDHLAGHGEATISAAGVDASVTADLAVDGQDGRIATRLHYADKELNLRAFEFVAPDFSLGGDLALGFAPGAVNVGLDASFVDVSSNRYAARGEAVVATSNQTWGVRIPALEIKGWDVVVVNIAGALGPEAVALRGELQPFDVGTFPMAGFSNLTGAVTGSLSVGGSMENPTVTGGVEVRGLSSTRDALDELPELDFQIAGGVANDRMFASTSITNLTIGHFSADVALPCALSFAPFNYKPEPKGVEVRLDGDLDLAILNRLAFFQNQLISGWLRTKVDYAAGAPSGFLKVEGGRYEHYDWGVVFHDFNADLEATPDGFITRSAAASDGGTGSVIMSGGLGANGLGLQLDFAGAQIIRRDEMEARVSGRLNVDGRPSRPDVSGELTIDRAEILLDNIAPPPPLALTDYDAAKTNWVGAAIRKKRKPPPVGLDVRINLPAQVFVIASMIETTLEGELHVTDAPNGVSIRGRIEPRRGYVNFIGSKFRFMSGDILLDGSIPNIAVLNNLTAEYARRDVTARLVLNGPVTNPRFRLESSPPMPEDEVLSHVLFNRDTSSISPYQAYQIAMAARQLSGGLNGPGFMFQVRQAIGVDTLEWREADAVDGASSVAAGKYITSGLYVEVNRELDSRGETGMMAELEVTRHFSVETYTGPKMRPGIGVNWRNDY